MSDDWTTLEVDGREVRVGNPGKVFFAARGETKLDLVQHYLTVGPGVLRGVWCRPTVLHRFPDGAEGGHFYQKRVPERRPEWLETALVTFPSGRTATELCPTDLAHVVWAVNLGCLELHPWAVRRFDPHRPDELRVDLDPAPGLDFEAVRRAAYLMRDLLGFRRRPLPTVLGHGRNYSRSGSMHWYLPAVRSTTRGSSTNPVPGRSVSR